MELGMAILPSRGAAERPQEKRRRDQGSLANFMARKAAGCFRKEVGSPL